MLNRRELLLGAPGGAAFVRRAAGQSGTRIREIDIVHHTHTDIGYTEFPLVIRDLQKRYLDAAIDSCQADRSFRWTIESLVGLDDWWRTAGAARRNLLLTLIRAGQVDAMAMPFNQTAFLNARQWKQMMRWIPDGLWRSLGIRAAMQNDVNGMPRAGAMALLDRGVSRLLMGINADSGGPPFRRPAAFWWKMPDGRRMFVWLGEHYGSAMAYLGAKRTEHRMALDEAALRSAHGRLTERVRAIEAEGYGHERLILTFTHPAHYDNGGPYPSLAPFVTAWNRLELSPKLRFATATDAVLRMEKAVGPGIPVMEGEWTDWWANGDASGPREVAASRRAKRVVAAAESPLWGPAPPAAAPEIERIVRDLCLFDEHTWGASTSIREPYGMRTIAQYGQKSDLAYRPLGFAEKLLERRARARIDALADGVHVANPFPAAASGWVSVAAAAVKDRAMALEESSSGGKVELRKEGQSLRFWVEGMAPRTIRSYRPAAGPVTVAAGPMPEIRTDASGWPSSATWPGMRAPLFAGALGEFRAVAVMAPADRRTIAQLHANPKADEREAIRKKSFRGTAATAGAAKRSETPHTVLYTQDFRHDRLAQARRSVEFWKREPRARVTVRFDRLSLNAPEVFFLEFAFPGGLALPLFSCGGAPYTPYRDTLAGSCRDYFAIDGWARYRSPEGCWLWVTRDAPLVAVGGTHVVERHQAEPAQPNRLLAMVFDNCWHTNFVADSHGTMEFQFDLMWSEEMERPADLAEAMAGEFVTVVNQPVREEPAVIRGLYRG